MAVLYRLAVQVASRPDLEQLESFARSYWQASQEESWDVSTRSADGLWALTASVANRNERRRMVLGHGVHGEAKWVWLEISLPDLVACSSAQLEPAPAVAGRLLDQLDLHGDDANLRSPILLRTETALDEAIKRARSREAVSYFLSSEVEQHSLTRTQEVLHRYVYGLGEIFVIEPALFPLAQDLLGLRWSGPGSAVVLSRSAFKSVSASAVSRQPEAAGRLLQSYGLTLATWLLPVDILRRLRLINLMATKESGDTDELYRALEEALNELSDRETNVIRLKDDLVNSQLDSLQFEEDLAFSQKENRRLRWQIANPEGIEEYAVAADEVAAIAPKCCVEVVLNASEFFEHLMITAGVGPAEQLDSSGFSEQWARSAWEMLAAVNDFVDAKRTRSFSGDLYRYASNPPLDNLPLVPSRVAMGESESTEINRELRRIRSFSVPREVDSSGRTYMGCHLKVAKGSPTPRIHLFDDSEGVTGKVIIGYFGAHLATGGR